MVASSPYTKLAAQTVEHYIRHKEYLPLPPRLSGDLLQQRACYITIFDNPGRRQRARAGRPLPQFGALAQEIIWHTAQAACSNPARPVTRPDLAQLSYDVALLGPLQRISDSHQLDPNQFGLYIQSDQSKSIVVLPERLGIETPDDQIATAMREAAIDPHQEAVTMYRFTVEHYQD